MTPVVEQVVENHTGRLSMIAKVNETGVQVFAEDASIFCQHISQR